MDTITFLEKEKNDISKTNGCMLKYSVIEDLLDSYNDSDELLGHMKDINNYGGVSGSISSLVYYSDTETFFEEYKWEINELLKEFLEETGLKLEDFNGYDDSDPLCLGQLNKNMLAWFAYEEINRRLLNELDMEE